MDRWWRLAGSDYKIHSNNCRLLFSEYAIDDDEYGHSVDDDAPISPTDAKQWLFDRERGQQSMSSFIANHRDIEEEDEEQGENPHRRNSEVKHDETFIWTAWIA